MALENKIRDNGLSRREFLKNASGTILGLTLSPLLSLVPEDSYGKRRPMPPPKKRDFVKEIIEENKENVPPGVYECSKRIHNFALYTPFWVDPRKHVEKTKKRLNTIPIKDKWTFPESRIPHEPAYWYTYFFTARRINLPSFKSMAYAFYLKEDNKPVYYFAEGLNSYIKYHIKSIFATYYPDDYEEMFKEYDSKKIEWWDKEKIIKKYLIPKIKEKGMFHELKVSSDPNSDYMKRLYASWNVDYLNFYSLVCKKNDYLLSAGVLTKLLDCEFLNFKKWDKKKNYLMRAISHEERYF